MVEYHVKSVTIGAGWGPVLQSTFQLQHENMTFSTRPQGEGLAIFKDNNDRTPSKGPIAWLLDLANFLIQTVSPSALSDTCTVLASSV